MCGVLVLSLGQLLVAVVFDFVEPLFAIRRLGLQRGPLGLNEPWQWCGYALAITQLKTARGRAGIFAYFFRNTNNRGE